ncbi:codeine O-demethylase-like [Quercus suber]|uniref:codeine O-demethylase-like n=1 Tax=Quercus suber TaxID=58331 RepID=UPI0032DEB92D
MEKAKADAVAEFRDSQLFIDACGVYYGVGFEDYLKQVGSIYPDLDLSKVTLNDPVSTTLMGSDTIDKESNDFTHIEEQDPKDDSVVLTQPVPDGPVTPLIVSNGIYRSIEHRATVNSTNERLSIATFHRSNLDSELGPAPSLIGPDNPANFRRVSMEKYFEDLFARKLDGKSYIHFMRIENGVGNTC